MATLRVCPRIWSSGTTWYHVSTARHGDVVRYSMSATLSTTLHYLYSQTATWTTKTLLETKRTRCLEWMCLLEPLSQPKDGLLLDLFKRCWRLTALAIVLCACRLLHFVPSFSELVHSRLYDSGAWCSWLTKSREIEETPQTVPREKDPRGELQARQSVMLTAANFVPRFRDFTHQDPLQRSWRKTMVSSRIQIPKIIREILKHPRSMAYLKPRNALERLKPERLGPFLRVEVSKTDRVRKAPLGLPATRLIVTIYSSRVVWLRVLGF